LLGDTTGVEADCASGAALGALAQAVARGEIVTGSRVVLVVTGARPRPIESEVARLTTVTPDADAVLSVLGLNS